MAMHHQPAQEGARRLQPRGALRRSTFALFFLYPLLKVVQMSFTDAPLIGGGDWVGPRQLRRSSSPTSCSSPRSKNNGYFVLLTVIPTTVIAL